jgi:hypothetical protein
VARTRWRTRAQSIDAQPRLPLVDVAPGEKPSQSATHGQWRVPGDSGRVRIEAIIQHQLDNTAAQPLLAQAPSVLPTKTHDLFASYIAATASRADWIGGFADPDSEIAGCCDALLGDEMAFVEASRKLAERLFTQMKPRTISAGDLAVVVYSADGNAERHIALLKLDAQVRQVRSFKRIAGRLRAVYDEATNTLPDKGQLQKCALVARASGRAGHQVVLLDTQAGPRATDVAIYFYKGFLGVTLAPSPRRLTRRFVELCDTWLERNRNRLSPAEMFAFYAARRRALAGETIEVNTFAAEALGSYPDLRADLADHLASNLMETELPSRIERFAVDTAIVSGLLRTVTLELDGGARLRVRADRLESLLDMGALKRVGNTYELVLRSLTLREVSD